MDGNSDNDGNRSVDRDGTSRNGAVDSKRVKDELLGQRICASVKKYDQEITAYLFTWTTYQIVRSVCVSSLDVDDDVAECQIHIKLFLKDPCPPLDSQDDLLPRDALGRFIYTQLPSPVPVHQRSPIMNHPDTEANTTGKMMAGSKRRREEETDPQPQTPRQFGNGLTNTQRAKSVSPLRLANKRPRLGQALDIEIKSRTEKLEEAIRNLQGEDSPQSSKKGPPSLHNNMKTMNASNSKLHNSPPSFPLSCLSRHVNAAFIQELSQKIKKVHNENDLQHQLTDLGRHDDPSIPSDSDSDDILDQTEPIPANDIEAVIANNLVLFCSIPEPQEQKQGQSRAMREAHEVIRELITHSKRCRRDRSGQPHIAAATGSSAQRSGDLAMDVQAQFESYRQEMGVDTSKLREDLPNAQRELGRVNTDLAKANAKIQHLDEQLALQSRDLDKLTIRNQQLYDQQMHLNIDKEHILDELATVKSSLEHLRNEVANLRAEKKVWETEQLAQARESLVGAEGNEEKPAVYERRVSGVSTVTTAPTPDLPCEQQLDQEIAELRPAVKVAQVDVDLASSRTHSATIPGDQPSE
ncbi:hypothetical protein EDC04DRAFT_2915159 [Pisolithus marmoratus]|nr:hypothetical protein EDC04DRAFT_2915159 [Pisolithus marmoratus]